MLLRPTIAALYVMTTVTITASFVIDSPPSTASPEANPRSDVTIAIGATAASGAPSDAALAPGDAFRHEIDLALTGRPRSTITLVISALSGRSSKLDVDAHNGLQVALDRCPAAIGWQRPVGGSPIGSRYACSKPIVHVLVPVALAQAKGRVFRLADVAPGQVAHLLLTLKLAATAGNDFEKLHSSLRFTFTSRQ